MSKGTVIQIIGAVIDVEFPKENLPKIYDEEPKEEVSDEDLISRLQSFGYTTETMQFMLLRDLPASARRPCWCLL